MRNERRIQKVTEEIKQLIQKPEAIQLSPAAPPTVEEESVPRWLAPDPMPEAALVPRRSKVGIIVCFSLAIAVPAIAAPFVASKLPGGETVAVAEERSNETPSFQSRLWKQDSNVAERPPSAQLSANQRCVRNQGELC